MWYTRYIDDEPQHIGDAIDESLLRFLPAGVLAAYQEEKQKHREAKRAIDRAYKAARSRLTRLFGEVRDRIEAEVEHQYAERLREENEQHQAFLTDLGKLIRGEASG